MDLESRGNLYYLCSKTKKLISFAVNRKAHLHLCFRICKKLIFLQRGSFCPQISTTCSLNISNSVCRNLLDDSREVLLSCSCLRSQSSCIGYKIMILMEVIHPTEFMQKGKKLYKSRYQCLLILTFISKYNIEN